jgi:hypothetical protein
MATIHPQLKTAFIFPDGEGGWRLQVMDQDNCQFVYALTLARAARLCGEAAHVVQDLSRQKQEQGT